MEINRQPDFIYTRQLAADFISLLVKLDIEDYTIEEVLNPQGEFLGLDIIFPMTVANDECVNARLHIDEAGTISNFSCMEVEKTDDKE